MAVSHACSGSYDRWRNLQIAIGLLAVVLVTGTVGYMTLDGMRLPDAVYTTDYLEAGGQSYVEGESATFELGFAPVKDLLAFAKARQKTKTDNK